MPGPRRYAIIVLDKYATKSPMVNECYLAITQDEAILSGKCIDSTGRGIVQVWDTKLGRCVWRK